MFSKAKLHPVQGLTHPAEDEPSSIYEGTAPPSGSHAGTCKPTVKGVWPEGHPVSPSTRMPLVPLVVRLLHRPHTALSLGTVPGTVGQWSTHDELQHSQSQVEEMGILLMWISHLRRGKVGGKMTVKFVKWRSKNQQQC
ncbi:hypothetical protein GOODEAATRI_026011 [Goodea atripinnis]|uniref:Uncharacterized protein n=1 Tax=Goodea atripinnis TaxID=208336 RepID=A0ABV0MV80_9TELE